MAEALGWRGYVDGLWGQVHYRAAGEGAPLLMVHQSPWSSMQYHAVLPRLAALGMAVRAPDSPGYGMSDPAPEGVTIADHADNLVAVIAAMGLGSVTVVGHHTGALIAASLAARYPALVSRVVLDNCPFYTPDERETRLRGHGGTLEIRPDGSHLTERWALMRRVADKEMTDASIQLAVMAWCEAGRDTGHRAAFSHDAGPDIAAIAAPVLLIASRTDPICGHADRIAAVRPEFARAELPGGTGSVLENPEGWVAALQPFLER
ncbi:alpha/beta fold hydrolase [Polymorphobacter sp.]|uniref:alpha/beta fold hydrolase n=1 Tax=Polymorphobacter sp. TaxID=1909290 RepID=UPI003F703EC1